MMKKMVAVVVAALAVGLAWAEKPVFKGLVPAEEVRARAGVGNLMKKIREGQKEIVVAYLGGSITAMNGWRNLTTDWLRKTYPGVTFREVHAAIGGTGSNLGVFRLGHDALRHKPDLLFVEFATNDGGAAPESIWRSMEGIVRQTWRRDATTDIVFTYTITSSMMGDYGRGLCPRAASAMEQLADHYGIPSIGFGPRVAAEVKAGRLVMNMKDAEKETAVPVETPARDKAIAEQLAKEGKTLFAKDGVHPALPGHEFYLKSIIAGFTQMKDSQPVDHLAQLLRPFVADNMAAAKMVPVHPEMLTGSWRKLPADDGKMKAFSNRMGDIWYAQEPGDKLKFKFKGTCCMIYDLLGPDGGQLWITVDGKRNRRPVPRFDSYCTYHRIATLNVFDGADGVHEVEIEVDKDQPSRQSVAFRLKDPAGELSQPKYQGTKFWPAKIMLVGELVM
ncbi:MAG: SGNH/GDSL hydrolase family protein [Kiritimatiellia bacterium]